MINAGMAIPVIATNGCCIERRAKVYTWQATFAHQPSTILTREPKGEFLMLSSSTSSANVELGGISPMPLSPYACSRSPGISDQNEKPHQIVLVESKSLGTWILHFIRRAHQVWWQDQLPLAANLHAAHSLCAMMGSAWSNVRASGACLSTLLPVRAT